VHPIKLVIFDCDGVLVDSEPIAIDFDVRSLAGLGWELTADEIVRRFVGRSRAAMFAEIEAHLGRPLPDGWAERFDRDFNDRLRAELEPVDGIHEALAVLDGTDLATCVASSGSHEKMRLTLGLTGLWERFQGRIFSAREVARGKPAPDLFLHAAARMGLQPSACAVVEDSRYGVEAARAAGMRAFGYAGSVTGADALRGPGTVVFSDMRELPGLLAVG
jgi:HAD superfamily hydrolase (TIGR01509 family)